MITIFQGLLRSMSKRDREKTSRIFTAVHMSRAAHEALYAMMSSVAKKHSIVRPIPAYCMHVTFHFFAALSERSVTKLIDHVSTVTRESIPFQVTLSKTGMFPHSEDPRLVWVGIGDGAERLIALKSAIDARIIKKGFAVEKRAFVPHLTVARVRDQHSHTDFIPDIVTLPIDDMPPQRIDRISILKSTLLPTGSHYETLADCFFRNE